MKKIYWLIVSFLVLFMPSCSDYLDVSDELAGELKLEEVFQNASYCRKFHRNIFTGIHDMYFICINSR